MPTPELHSAQRRAVEKLVTERGGLVFHRVGEGKTRLGLAAFERLKGEYNWGTNAGLLVVCRAKAFHTWKEEIELCYPEWQVSQYDVKRKFALMQNQVWLISEGILARRKEMSYRIIGDDLVNMVIFDEGYLYKNPRAKRSTSATRIADNKVSVVLSGSMMTAGRIEDLYGQMMAAGKHRRVARNVSDFRQRFCMQVNAAGFAVWTAQKDAYARIAAMMEPFTDIHFPKDNQRKVTEKIITVPATYEQKNLFKELKETYAIEKHGIELNHTIELINYLQQISGGAIKHADGTITSVASDKIEFLRAELDQLMDAGERVVIWTAFKHETEMLAATLPFASMQMSSDHKLDVARLRSNEVRLVIATEASGSSINDLAGFPYAFFYSQNYKWLDLQQSMGRTNRRSSEHQECFYYFLHTKGGIDRDIYMATKTSGNMEGKLINTGAVLQDWIRK